MVTFIRLMEYPFMSLQYLYSKAANVMLRTMMTYASSVQMVGNLCFVMGALGLSIKVNIELYVVMLSLIHI